MKTCSIYVLNLQGGSNICNAKMVDLSVVRGTGIMRKRKQQIHTTIQVLLLAMPACPFVNRHFDGDYLC